jgi:uncharacterized surface protein with fasciclin (FAS1) repeats
MKNSILKIGFVAITFLVIGCADNFVEVPLPTGSTIVQIASSNTDLNILTSALNKTALASSFANNNSGTFTVFAPTDAAFVSYFNSLTFVPALTAPLDEAGVLALINTLTPTTTPISIATLSNILLYHVVTSEMPSSKITGSQGFVTLSGTARLSVSKVGANIVLNADRSGNGAGNGGQGVTLDVDASNGIIHTINKVLIPVTTANIWAANLLNFSVNYAVSPPAVTVYGTVLRRAAGSINLTDAAALAPVDATGTNYNLLSMAIARAELATVIIPIATPFPDFTVFAPTDAAFLAYLGVADEAAARTALNNLAPAALADVVKYHVVAGRVVSSDLSNGKVVTTSLPGGTFTVNIAGSVITIADKNTSSADATISGANILTNAGVLHQINGVLRAN